MSEGTGGHVDDNVVPDFDKADMSTKVFTFEDVEGNIVIAGNNVDDGVAMRLVTLHIVKVDVGCVHAHKPIEENFGSAMGTIHDGLTHHVAACNVEKGVGT